MQDYQVREFLRLVKFIGRVGPIDQILQVQDFKHQIMPIAVTSLVDYIGLVAQRGIEGDTALQKWLEVKSSSVNVKQKE